MVQDACSQQKAGGKCGLGLCIAYVGADGCLRLHAIQCRSANDAEAHDVESTR